MVKYENCVFGNSCFWGDLVVGGQSGHCNVNSMPGGGIYQLQVDQLEMIVDASRGTVIRHSALFNYHQCGYCK